MYTVSFNPADSRFKIEPIGNWVGDPVYDFGNDPSEEALRGFESDSEANIYDGLEDVLQMGIGHINNIFATNGVSFDRGV
jgi:hypothetical protein